MPATGVDMEPFSLLAHDIRIDILEACLEHVEPRDPTGGDSAPRGVRYSTLMDAVGMEDSGKFNYHLEQLRGVYLEQTDDRYVPTRSAIALYRTVLATQPTADEAAADLDIDASCPACDRPVQARYLQGVLVLDCPHCTDWWGLQYPFPRHGITGRTGPELFDALTQRAIHDVGLARTGQCPDCAGHTTVELAGLDGTAVPTAQFTCRTCSWIAAVDVLNALRSHPQVASVLNAVGLIPGSGTDDTMAVTGEPVTDTDQIRLTIHGPAGCETVVVDETLSVVATGTDKRGSN